MHPILKDGEVGTASERQRRIENRDSLLSYHLENSCRSCERSDNVLRTRNAE